MSIPSFFPLCFYIAVIEVTQLVAKKKARIEASLFESV